MAIIHSNAIGKAFGSVGMITYKTVGGATIASDKVFRPSVPRTVSQMVLRTTWANVVALWQSFTQRDKPSFEDRAPRVSHFNAFMSANYKTPVYLTKDEARQGGCVVAPYVITRGSLPAIAVGMAQSGAAQSDIAVGALVIDQDTTLGDFSKAIINNNNGWQDGDQLTYFEVRQVVDSVTHIPHAEVFSNKITLNSDSEDYLSDILESHDGFDVVDGKITAPSIIQGGNTWVHSRKTGDGHILVSSQKLIVNNQLLAQYQTTAKMTAAILSYGGKTEREYLVPDTDAAIMGN